MRAVHAVQAAFKYAMMCDTAVSDHVHNHSSMRSLDHKHLNADNYAFADNRREGVPGEDHLLAVKQVVQTLLHDV